jgi:hypothetical protein
VQRRLFPVPCGRTRAEAYSIQVIQKFPWEDPLPTFDRKPVVDL